MEIEKRKMAGGYVLFSIKGELTLKTGKDFLEPVLREIASGKAPKIGIDISRVRYIDSFGIGCILKCNNAMEQRSGIVGKIHLILTDRLRGKLAVVGLDRILTCEVIPEHTDPAASMPAEPEPPQEEKESSGDS